MNFALAALSGALLFLIHPLFNFVWLAPFALAPLLVALAREWRPGYRFALGYVAGAVFWGGMCYWIQYVMAVHGGLGQVGGAGVFLLFCLTPSVNMAFFGLLAGTVLHKRYALPVIAALWVACERIPTPFGFMWLKLGDAGTDMDLPMRLAPFLGVYGLSFAFAMMSSAIVFVILRRKRVELLWGAVVVLMYLFPVLPQARRGTESAIAVQPNLPEEKDWTRAEVDDMQRHLAFLSLQAALSGNGARARLVLWPEAPAPLYYYDDPAFRERLTELARATGANLLIGTVAHTVKGDPLNSAVMISPSGEVAGRYDKNFLVPFGEYVPSPFGFANKISSEIGNFVPGEKLAVLPGGVGAFICYESAFPHLIRQFAAQGATVFANLSNDGYFGHSAAREQHLKLVRMRAAENRRWILRGTNDGITADIDPAGRVVQRLAPYTETADRLWFTPVNEVSWYSKHGDWFAWLCVAGGLMSALAGQLPRMHRGEN
jgi:apolipoprotein N-acyltransferase